MRTASSDTVPGVGGAPDVTKRSFRASLFAMLGITVALMLSALDQTVIGNILPSMVADLNGFDLYAWVATGYMLTSMIAIPVFGRLGDLFGRKRFLLIGIALFVATSVWCGASTTMLGVVLARIVQGIGGGMLIGAGQASVPDLFPDTRERLRWQIVLNLVFTVSNAAGPVVGGWLAQHYGWRYVFYLNVPLGALAFAMAWRYLPRITVARQKKASIDWLGAVLICVVLVSLQMFVGRVQDQTAEALAALVVCVVSVMALVRVERLAKEPFLPQALFKQRELRLMFILATLSGAIMFAVLFYVPLLFQAGFGYAPALAGLLMLPFAASSSIGSIASSRLLMRMQRPEWLPRTGFIMLTFAVAGLALSNASMPRIALMMLTMTAGLGLGFILLNLTIFTQSAADRSIIGVASALQKSLRLVGGLLGTALIGGAVNILYRHNVDRLFAAAGHAAASLQFHNPRSLMDTVPGVTEGLATTTTAVTAETSATLTGLARTALEQATTVALATVCLLGAVSLWVMWRVPHIDLVSGAGRERLRPGAAVRTDAELPGVEPETKPAIDLAMEAAIEPAIETPIKPAIESTAESTAESTSAPSVGTRRKSFTRGILKMQDRKLLLYLLMIAPAVIFIFAAFVAPVVAMLSSSVMTQTNQGIGFPLTLHNYGRIIADPLYAHVLLVTVRIAVVTTLLCIVVGFPIAMIIARGSAWYSRIATIVVVAPLVVSVVIRTYGWSLILANNKGGVLNFILAFLGFGPIATRLMYTETAVIIASMHVFLPMMVLPLAAAISRVAPSLEEAGATLGAGGWRVFFTIVVPLCRPGILVGSTVVFSLAAASFVVPSILGGSYALMVGNFVEQQILSVYDWPFGSAIAVVMVLMIYGVNGLITWSLTSRRQTMRGI